MDKEKLEKLVSEGKSTRELAGIFNLGQSTIRYWLKKHDLKTNIKRNTEIDKFISVEKFIGNKWELYSYVYGLYLGDGCVYRHKEGVYALMIALDAKYPLLVKNVIYSLGILSGNKVNSKIRYNSCYNLTIYHKHMLDLFPKFGKGFKYENKVYIPEPLLNNICYKALLKGLFQSDGSYYYDKHNKKYFYNFTNMSKDIIDIFILCLNKLNIKYDLNQKRNKAYCLSIRRKAETIKMFNIIGIKE